jgi:hypothetical protein
MRRTSTLPTILLALLCVVNFVAASSHAETTVSVDVTKTGPRSVERLTEQSVARNYRDAWDNLSRALQFSLLEPLDGPFTGVAKDWLIASVAGQRQSGLTQRYLNQNHTLEAVFYAPEGDVMELHDTASYHEQVWDGGRLIQEQSVVVHYIVLMTPSADRWVVRNLQAVSHF